MKIIIGEINVYVNYSDQLHIDQYSIGKISGKYPQISTFQAPCQP